MVMSMSSTRVLKAKDAGGTPQLVHVGIPLTK